MPGGHQSARRRSISCLAALREIRTNQIFSISQTVYSNAQNDLSHFVTCWAKDILFSLSTPSLPLKEMPDLGFDAFVLRSSIQSEIVWISTFNWKQPLFFSWFSVNVPVKYKAQTVQQTLVHMLDGSCQPTHTAKNEGNTARKNGKTSIHCAIFFRWDCMPRFHRGLHAPQTRTPPIPVATRRPVGLWNGRSWHWVPWISHNRNKVMSRMASWTQLETWPKGPTIPSMPKFCFELRRIMYGFTAMPC